MIRSLTIGDIVQRSHTVEAKRDGLATTTIGLAPKRGLPLVSMFLELVSELGP